MQYLQKGRDVKLNLFATTLNQDNEQHDSDNAGNYPDDRCIVHVGSPFLLVKKLLEGLDHDEDRGSEGDDKD